MMRLLLVIVFIFVSVHADEYDEFSYQLENKNYAKACKIGRKIIFSDEKDEKLLSIIAQSCLKVDYIYALSIVQHKLRKNTESRADAAIFSSIVLQKKLIHQFMYDDTDITPFYLPVTDTPLSKAFVAIRDKNYKLISKSPKIIEFKKNAQKYKVYIDHKDSGRVIIEVKDKSNSIRKHRYI